MTISMHRLLMPTLARTISNLGVIIKKGHDHAIERDFDPSRLLDFRLYPDMFSFKAQVQVATDTAKFAPVRLGGIEAPKFDDTETTFEELHDRIAKTVAFLESVTPEQIDGTEDKEVVMKRRGTEIKMSGLEYVTVFVLPQTYFHVTTAYGILRHNGVDLGKLDYLRGNQ